MFVASAAVRGDRQAIGVRRSHLIAEEFRPRLNELHRLNEQGRLTDEQRVEKMQLERKIDRLYYLPENGLRVPPPQEDPIVLIASIGAIGVRVATSRALSSSPPYTSMKDYIPRLDSLSTPAGYRLSANEVRALSENLAKIVEKTVPAVRHNIRAGRTVESATQSLQNQLNRPRWRFIDQVPNGQNAIQNVLREFPNLRFGQ